jgi:hypothetical protein
LVATNQAWRVVMKAQFVNTCERLVEMTAMVQLLYCLLAAGKRQ